MSVLGDVNIREAVAIVVAYSNPHSIAAAEDARCFCDVSEGAITIVAIEGITEGWARIVEVAVAAVHQVNVHPAVIVIV